MSAAAIADAPIRGAWLPTTKLGDWALALLVFLGGFVLFEPAPYDLLIPAVLIGWTFAGLSLNRHMAPMAGLMLVWLAGGAIALTQTAFFNDTVVKLATTALLIGSAIFYAAVVAAAPERRVGIIRTAYVAGATLASLAGVLGYFGVIPGSELFVKYGRAMGPFQDPNVFGPFLILPAILLAQDFVTRPLRSAMWSMPWLLILLAGIFLSGSRAAWGLTVMALLLVVFVAYVNEPRAAGRLRLLAFVGGGLLVLLVLMAAALSVPAVHELLNERAQLVQEYDGGRLGRFERHVIGFFLMLGKPLGIGPFIFGMTYGEDEHNTWLKAFTVYGWLGGFAYISLALWTVAAATPLLFKPRPWREVLIAAYAVYLGHLAVHFVIDQDSWRHLFLLYGLIWGCIAAEKLRRRRGFEIAAPPPPSIRLRI